MSFLHVILLPHLVLYFYSFRMIFKTDSKTFFFRNWISFISGIRKIYILDECHFLKNNNQFKTIFFISFFFLFPIVSTQSFYRNEKSIKYVHLYIYCKSQYKQWMKLSSTSGKRIERSTTRCNKHTQQQHQHPIHIMKFQLIYCSVIVNNEFKNKYNDIHKVLTMVK